MKRLLAVLLLIVATHSAHGQELPIGADLAKLEKQRCPRPTEFALVFSFGYAGDQMPKDDARFEKLLKAIREGGFNTIHCTFTDTRLALCKKHGVKMMIDLLAPEHHVYKSPEKAKALCLKLRGESGVWGYNIWNDTFAKTGPGRRRDVNTVRTWDPTHPAYSGTYRTAGMRHLTNADVLGYYDFHWKRGIGQHFPHLLAYSTWARERDACFYTWLSATSGRAGQGNFNRSLWSANTGIACGLKGILWFLATDLMDPKTLEWKPAGADIRKVNLAVLPLAKELAKLTGPTAICSTPITKTANNDPLPNNKTVMPPGLEKHAFPKDFPVQPVSGEFMLGRFQGKKGLVFFYVANNNAYVGQDVALRLNGPRSLQRFDRGTGRWQPLDVRDGAVRFALSPGGGELLRTGD